jgi:CheY-like chemotaxis protein
LILLAGRKLLLADDSITIQKVVTLTFSDEGVEVETVSDGHEAIEKLKQSTPDIVLADAVMPRVNGYEVCEYIKQDPKLKHIPVMLLVGSFEPFDEAEARRVGADDYVTKPFQSIRRFMEKVGGLVGGKTTENEAPTAELRHVEEAPAEQEKLSTEEIEITTADTQPLPAVEQLPEVAAAQAALAQQAVQNQDKRLRENHTMDNVSRAWERDSSPNTTEALLDLGDIGRSRDVVTDDFVLDIDLAEFEPADNVETVSEPRSFVEPEISEPTVVPWGSKVGEPAFAAAGIETTNLTESQFGETQEWPRPQPEAPVSFSQEAPVEVEESRLERVLDEPEPSQHAVVPSGQIELNQLSPEAIDAIARRAVEMLSEKAVQEIAWEVVPQLAELLIKRKLEEKESQLN